MTTYDITFIGTGPASMFAVLKLLEKGFNGNICLIEKGRKLGERRSDEVLNGFCGAGAFSDSKYSVSMEVGGFIPGLTEEELERYENDILKTLNRFKKWIADDSILTWDTTKDFSTYGTSLTWDKHKVCHVGTEVGQELYKQIQDYIILKPNVQALFETEVRDVLKEGDVFKIISEKGEIFSREVVVATGQKGLLTERVVENFKLKTVPRPMQLGIRVEDISNPVYEEIIASNYDFKFVKHYEGGRVRTFCCNSGNAHVCAEVSSDGFTCFNGHAFKNKDEENKTVNYGIICEINSNTEKKEQVELMKKVNALPTWYTDNFENEELKPKRKLLDGFEQLVGVYPDKVIQYIEDFVEEFSKIVDLSNAYYFYPEIKISGKIPVLNPKTFATEEPGLFIIGDAGFTRSITKAAISGIRFVENLEEEK